MSKNPLDIINQPFDPDKGRIKHFANGVLNLLDRIVPKPDYSTVATSGYYFPMGRDTVIVFKVTDTFSQNDQSEAPFDWQDDSDAVQANIEPRTDLTSPELHVEIPAHQGTIGYFMELPEELMR